MDKLPYDNLYKFLTVLGILQAVSCSIGVNFVTTTHHALLRENIDKVIDIEEKGGGLSDVHIQAIHNLLETDTGNVEITLIILILLVFFGITMSVVGFILWHNRVQTLKDNLLKLEVQKKKLEHEKSLKMFDNESEDENEKL